MIPPRLPPTPGETAPPPRPPWRVPVAAGLALGAAVALSGCPWPRYSDLPSDSDVIPASEDPRRTVDVTWDERTEEDLVGDGGDNADPRVVTPVALTSMQGLAITGTLRGIGWNQTFEAPPLEGEGCDTRTRDPGQEGDWAGDVDFAVIDVDEAGMVLCADVGFAEAELGWDLLVYPLDADNCDLPEPPLSGPDGGVLGLGRAGATGGWKLPVEEGRRYGVLLAGYSAPEPVAEYGYELGLSLVPADERGTELCPRLPGGM